MPIRAAESASGFGHTWQRRSGAGGYEAEWPGRDAGDERRALRRGMGSPRKKPTGAKAFSDRRTGKSGPTLHFAAIFFAGPGQPSIAAPEARVVDSSLPALQDAEVTLKEGAAHASLHRCALDLRTGTPP